jgi:hypothetical protein
MCGRSSEHGQASHGRALGRDQRTGAQASFLQMAVHSSVAGSRVALVPIKQNGHPSPRGITRLPFPPLGRCRLSPPPPSPQPSHVTPHPPVRPVTIGEKRPRRRGSRAWGFDDGPRVRRLADAVGIPTRPVRAEGVQEGSDRLYNMQVSELRGPGPIHTSSSGRHTYNT